MTAALRTTDPIEMAAAVDPETLDAWFRSAAPGASAIYASGPDRPRGMPAVKLADDWHQQGLVRLHNRRDPANARRQQFLIVKLARTGADSGDGADRIEPELAEMLALLRRFHEGGSACPSNAWLARKLGLRDRFRARYLLEQLEHRGLIELRNRGRNAPRDLRILDGKVTAT